MSATALFIHRRDLRIHDNAGLYKALKGPTPVQPVFIFDRTILDRLEVNDQRVLFIHREIEQLKADYRRHGADLMVFYGEPLSIIPKLAKKLRAVHVFFNRDYEPYALQRDRELAALLKRNGVGCSGAKDHVIFEKEEILKNDGKPYTVYTPYMRKWKEKLADFYVSSYPTEKYLGNLMKTDKVSRLPDLAEMRFSDRQLVAFPDKEADPGVLTAYDQTRDIPAIEGTSKMSIHLRFGTVSIRDLVRQAQKSNAKYLDELIWRDFYQMILFHFPHSATHSFRKEYDSIRWEYDETLFQAWCDGRTGYPMVDAGMRELNTTGWMHNRVRMVVASFLTKHLLMDWRLGERYFAEKLLDFELASNVGGWQWAAGTGCDAAPYFRVFNPASQQQKFDPEFTYIKKWIPEFGTDDYPEPIVDHTFARERAIKRYKEGLSQNNEQ